MAVSSTGQQIATSIRAARECLAKHPDEARSSDASARATIASGPRSVVERPNGWRVETDMATGVGGGASAPSPGWLLRAALASCDAVLIAMQCAEEGLRLSIRRGSALGSARDYVCPDGLSPKTIGPDSSGGGCARWPNLPAGHEYTLAEMPVMLDLGHLLQGRGLARTF